MCLGQGLGVFGFGIFSEIVRVALFSGHTGAERIVKANGYMLAFFNFVSIN